jgi:hypothetical protein
MSAPEVKAVVAALKAALAQRGYAAKGQSFRRRTQEGNTLVLSVQKSRDPGPAKITLNYGVHSARVARRMQEDARAADDVWRAHWHSRIADGGRGRWIVLSPERTVDDVAGELVAYAERAVAELESHQSDQSLCDEWLTGRSPGLTEFQRLLHLVILLEELGPPARLDEALASLRNFVDGTPQAGLVRHYLGALWLR